MTRKDQLPIDFPRRLHGVFYYISCGKLFAIQSGINMILAKLSDYYMFQTARGSLIKMCNDCRVADVAQDEGMVGTSKFSQH